MIDNKCKHRGSTIGGKPTCLRGNDCVSIEYKCNIYEKKAEPKDLTLHNILEDYWFLLRHAEEGMKLYDHQPKQFEEKFKKMQAYADNHNPTVVYNFYPIEE